jgi:hypothetical protein
MGFTPTTKEEEHKSLLADNNPSRDTANDNKSPPIYYDSEPSSQPPRYPDTSDTYSTPTSASNPITSAVQHPKPPNQHRNSAPAATVAAVLACSYDDLDAQRRTDRNKKTLRERWRDFKRRNFDTDEYDAGIDRAGSSAEWNVQGASVGGGTTTAYRRK